jgi:hypothetical protein
LLLCESLAATGEHEALAKFVGVKGHNWTIPLIDQDSALKHTKYFTESTTSCHFGLVIS